MAFGSYINPDSNETNGCTPTGFSGFGNPTYDGVKTAGDCANKILLGVSNDGGSSFSTSSDPRKGLVVTQSRGQTKTDQFWQWSAFTRSGQLAVDYYDRQYGNDETAWLLGLQPVRELGPVALRAGPRDRELDAGADSVRGSRRRPVLR